MPKDKDKGCRICGKDIEDLGPDIDTCEYCVRKLKVPAKAK